MAARADVLPRLRERPLTRHRRAREAVLVRAAQRGSEEAVAELFARHRDDARRAALLVTGDRGAAEDIAREAFLAALRALPRFDLRRPLRPWLHRIVVNRAIDFARARALRAEVGADAAGGRCGRRPRWRRECSRRAARCQRCSPTATCAGRSPGRGP